MKNTRSVLHAFILLITCLSLLSCQKDAANGGGGGSYELSYGDSIFYLRPGSGDYIVSPVSRRDGRYEGFPEGIEIDDRTGAINVSKSETGLRYRITHTATDGTVTTTKVVLSGITFTDKFYRLSQSDSIASPVYNASASRSLPLSGSNFDEGNVANSGGCSVRTFNGSINLAETVRNGVFGTTPQNNRRETFEIKYRINDASGKSENKLKVLLYWYNSMADVPADLLETLRERQEQGVFLKGDITGRIEQTAKPRPPCIVIIAN